MKLEQNLPVIIPHQKWFLVSLRLSTSSILIRFVTFVFSSVLLNFRNLQWFHAFGLYFLFMVNVPSLQYCPAIFLEQNSKRSCFLKNLLWGWGLSVFAAIAGYQIFFFIGSTHLINFLMNSLILYCSSIDFGNFCIQLSMIVKYDYLLMTELTAQEKENGNEKLDQPVKTSWQWEAVVRTILLQKHCLIHIMLSIFAIESFLILGRITYANCPTYGFLFSQAVCILLGECYQFFRRVIDFISLPVGKWKPSKSDAVTTYLIYIERAFSSLVWLSEFLFVVYGFYASLHGFYHHRKMLRMR